MGHKAAQCKAPKRSGPNKRPSNRDRSPDETSLTSRPKSDGAARVADAEAYLVVRVGEQRREAILDSGCTHSILPCRWLPKGVIVKPISVKTTTADDRQVAMVGQADIDVRIGGQIYRMNVWLSDKISQFLLGYDWLGDPSVEWRVGSNQLIARGESVAVHVRSVGNNSRRIFSAGTVEIPPHHSKVVNVRCHGNVVLHTGWTFTGGELTPYTVVSRVALTALDDSAGVMVTNLGDSTVVVLEGMPLGTAERAYPKDEVFEITEKEFDKLDSTKFREENWNHYRKQSHGLGSETT